MSLKLSGLNPLSYLGVEPSAPPQVIVINRPPTPNDHRFNIGTIWIAPNTFESYILTSVVGGVATWVTFAGIGLDFTTDAGTAHPNVGGTTEILGGSNIFTNAAGNQIFIDLDNSPSISGNLTLPHTLDANTGNIKFGADPFIHNFGTNNTFLGANSGNYSLTTASENSGLGRIALSALTTGDSNTAVGDSALKLVNTGSQNSALGLASLTALTTGSFNTALGSNSGVQITTGSNNVALGAQTLPLITTGSDNIAVGINAGSALTVNDNNNILIGNAGVATDVGQIRIGKAGVHTAVNTVGTLTSASTITATSGNVVVTAGNLNLPTTTSTAGSITINASRFAHSFGTNNTYIGRLSGNYLLTGTDNTAVGAVALGSDTTGGGNTAIGSGSLVQATTGNQNTGLGLGTLVLTTTGSNNTALGFAAGSSLAAADSNNIMIGNVGTATDSGQIRIGTAGTHTAINTVGTLTSASTITATTGNVVVTAGNVDLPTTSATAGNININALRFAHSFGTNNTFIGSESGNYGLTVGTAVGSTAVGRLALTSLTTGLNNTAIGFGSLDALTSGGVNTALGANSLGALISGSNNTGIGLGSGLILTTGSNNTGVGAGSLQLITTGTDNIALGYLAGSALVVANSNNICIGSIGAAGINQIYLGTPGTQTFATIATAILTLDDGVNNVAISTTTSVAGAVDKLAIKGSTNVVNTEWLTVYLGGAPRYIPLWTAL